MSNTFTKPATVYFFADRDTGTVHDYHLNDSPRFDGLWTELDLDRVRAQGGLIVEDGEYITVSYSDFGMSSKLCRTEVAFNEDGSQFLYQGIVFDVYDSDGDVNFTMSKAQ